MSRRAMLGLVGGVFALSWLGWALLFMVLDSLVGGRVGDPLGDVLLALLIAAGATILFVALWAALAFLFNRRSPTD